MSFVATHLVAPPVRCLQFTDLSVGTDTKTELKESVKLRCDDEV